MIQHDSRAPWSVVHNLANMHWEACPGKPHALAEQVFPPHPRVPIPFAPPAMSLPAPVENKPLSSMHRRGDEVSALSKSILASAGWERKRKTEDQRKRELEEDEYTANVTATSVTCVGCHKEISLDKRSRYYPGPIKARQERTKPDA